MTDTTFKIDNDTTVTLVKINVRKWEVQDAKNTVLFTGKTRKMAFGYIDRLAAASKKPAAKVASKPEKPSDVVSKPAGAAAKDVSKPAKPAAINTDANLNHLKFGKTVDAKIIIGYGKKVWGGVLTLSNIHFKGNHFWMGTLTNDKGVAVENTRLDYAINYLKVPVALRSDAVIAVQEKALTAK